MDNLKQINEMIWEIPKGTEDYMKVPAHIFASKNMLGQIRKDRSLEQLRNVTSLPGIQSFACVMPDCHEGYGFPIGGVAAMDLDSGVISPGGIGYDINCGIRVLKSKFFYEEVKDKIPALCRELFRQIPSGVGKGGGFKLDSQEMDNVLNNGVRWAVKKGMATENDLMNTESFGSLASAEAGAVSAIAKERGRDQLGTMGAGNHFVEINYISDILDEERAKAFGLFKNQIVIQIHTGSRGLGHQVATDYIKTMVTAANKYKIQIPDRELSCAPINSSEGRQYFSAMSAAANFAWTNRQLITHLARRAWKNIFGSEGDELSLLYDVAHNIAKIEEHKTKSGKSKLMVHRKGATRAFPAGHPELTAEYKNSGHPVLIPGSMGTSSYILAGLEKNMDLSFGSACHGSGRMMSRTAARKITSGIKIKEELNKRGIVIETGSMKGLAEEAPQAYKNVESVVDVVENAGIAVKVARLKPLGVVKG